MLFWPRALPLAIIFCCIVSGLQATPTLKTPPLNIDTTPAAAPHAPPEPTRADFPNPLYFSPVSRYVSDFSLTIPSLPPQDGLVWSLTLNITGLHLQPALRPFITTTINTRDGRVWTHTYGLDQPTPELWSGDDTKLLHDDDHHGNKTTGPRFTISTIIRFKQPTEDDEHDRGPSPPIDFKMAGQGEERIGQVKVLQDDFPPDPARFDIISFGFVLGLYPLEMDVPVMIDYRLEGIADPQPTPHTHYYAPLTPLTLYAALPYHSHRSEMKYIVNTTIAKDREFYRDFRITIHDLAVPFGPRMTLFPNDTIAKVPLFHFLPEIEFDSPDDQGTGRLANCNFNGYVVPTTQVGSALIFDFFEGFTLPFSVGSTVVIKCPSYVLDFQHLSRKTISYTFRELNATGPVTRVSTMVMPRLPSNYTAARRGAIRATLFILCIAVASLGLFSFTYSMFKRYRAEVKVFNRHKKHHETLLQEEKDLKEEQDRHDELRHVVQNHRALPPDRDNHNGVVFHLDTDPSQQQERQQLSYQPPPIHPDLGLDWDLSGDAY